MKEQKIHSISTFFILIIFFALGFMLVGQPSKNIRYVKIAEQSVKVDLAVTSVEHMQGLSGRLSLKAGEGMLFIFSRSGDYPFWMKDMNFPIDIIWLNETRKVIYIKKDARPESYPETFVSEENAKYVLEVVSGFSDKNKLKLGDLVEFTY